MLQIMEDGQTRRTSPSRVRWMLNEIQYVLKKGIIDAGSAHRLTQHYEARLLNYKKILLYIFGTLGAVLIGSGIVLVIAQYWFSVPRVVKLLLSAIVLLTAQILVARFCLFAKQNNRFVDESLAVFWSLAFGSMLYLVGDVLNLPRAPRTFLLTWSLAVLPVFYLQKSIASLFIYTGLVIGWLSLVSNEHGVAVPLYGLYGALVPFYLWVRRRDKGSVRHIILKYWLAAAAIISVALLMHYPFNWFLIPSYAGMVGVLYFSGELFEAEEAKYLARPLTIIGLFGIFVHSLVMSIEDIWLFYRIDTIISDLSIPSYTFVEDVVLLPLLLCAGSIVISFYFIAKRKMWFHTVPALYCFLVIVLNLVSIWVHKSFVFVFPWIINIYTLVFASLYVFRGFKKQSLFHMNVGSLFILAVIIIRLFGYDMSLWIRGVTFICIGSAYVFLNYKLIKKKRKILSS